MTVATPTYTQIAARAFRERRLWTVMIELTYRCNLDCYFCYNDVSQKGTALSLEQYLTLLDDLREMEVMNLILTGGEPLSHPDFFAIGERARELDFVVRVKSNGHALGGVLLRRLRHEVDPWQVEVSLHGACAETHDRQTRVPGSFERLLRNLGEMKEIGMRLRINSTLTRWNEGEVQGMLELAERVGAPLFIDTVVTPRDDGDLEPLRIAATDEGVRNAFVTQADFQARQAAAAGAVPTASREPAPLNPTVKAPEDRPHCGAGVTSITVDPFGNVYPCVQWRRPVGNLHAHRVPDLWQGSGLGRIREENHEVHRAIAGLGEKGKIAAFCPGLAEQHTGSHTGVYDSAQRRIDLLGPLIEERRGLRIVD